MRIVSFLLPAILIYTTIFAQAPQGLNYQAVARNSDGSIVSGQSIGVRFSILDGSANGSVIYQERHQSTTNNFGLFTLVIGRGSVLTGTFSAINWGADTKFLKVEIALQGGSSYQLQGITQLISVPYALYAEKSGNAGTPGPVGPAGPTGPAGSTGPQGIAGPTGTTGPQGPTGAIGPAGAVGATGLQGVAGSQGPMGSAGPQGPAGIVGATGLPGPIGLTGSTGQQGVSGKTILNGITDPTNDAGVIGDFYLNTTTNQFYGPKTTGGWGNGVSLIGPAGGPPGLKSLINLENFSATTNCPTGGVTVKSGVDQNSNNILDPNEVDNTKQICFTQSSDKVVIMPFFSYDDLSYSGSYNSPKTPFGAIVKFSKKNYFGVDSIILVANTYVWNNGNTGFLQLYNITDNVPIANSIITTTNSVVNGNVFSESKNVFSSLPDKEITIGLSLSSASPQSAGVSKAFLVLYRK